MLYIKCPFCGYRSQKEFADVGDWTVKRPKLKQNKYDEKWNEFIYLRKSLRVKHIELWHHVAGCRQWFKVQRNTVTHEIFQTAKMNEEIKWVNHIELAMRVY